MRAVRPWCNNEAAMNDKEKVEIYENVLDEIAHGAPWGGPASDHIRFMRKVAHEALVKTGVEESE